MRAEAALLFSCLTLTAHAAGLAPAHGTTLDGAAAAAAAQRSDQPASGPIRLVPPPLPPAAIVPPSTRQAGHIVTYAGDRLPLEARDPPPGLTILIQSIAPLGSASSMDIGAAEPLAPSPDDLVIEASTGGLPELALRPPQGRVVNLKFNPQLPPIQRESGSETAPGATRLVLGAGPLVAATGGGGPSRTDIVINYDGGELPATARNPPSGKQVWLRAMPVR